MRCPHASLIDARSDICAQHPLNATTAASEDHQSSCRSHSRGLVGSRCGHISSVPLTNVSRVSGCGGSGDRATRGHLERINVHVERFVAEGVTLGLPKSVARLAGERWVAIRVALDQFFEQTPGQKAGSAL